MISSHSPGLSSLTPTTLSSAQRPEPQDPQQLLSQSAQKHIEGKAPRGFQPLTAEQAANNILGFIERQLERDVVAGATQDELQSRLEAGLAGFKKGFNEAKEKLDALGMLNDQVSKDIGETYQRVTDGIDDFAARYGLTEAEPAEEFAVPALGQVTQANYEYASAQSFSFELLTAEGDKVTIQASASRGESASFENSSGSASYSYASVASSQYQLTVQGDLNDQEQAAIDELLGQVNQLADEFFTGDLQTAFDYASDLGYDAEQISGFALNLTRVEIQRASVAYQPQASEQDLSSKLKPIGDFLQDLNGAVDDASGFAQPQNLLLSMIESMYGDETVPGNRDGQRFVDFIGQFLAPEPSEQAAESDQTATEDPQAAV
ncbi:DUF5610 domain-containing protein [Gilvimarinus sp. SDUM040013]|uniref:DUF5610 domain-containing protein n=1 Tax=Gilvimarinus gilvus TaxID=3058038 RepID=A0ABU4RXN0_9GAMM|nr:DUF5610 domain-containing protein [Gilvimarinus sp. SDUM040013]MDO3386404.1 DUF5610 domain-containing protein [Gilvimarinus sp. SDUM040013]MDX6849670.1 DUF5610 domain-containing protein [Gilvimarinus sp. SDUM040013]